MWRAWNPFRELDTLRREIDRVFEGYRTGRPVPFRSAFLPGRSNRGYPLMNAYEDPEAFHVHALAPGLDPESLEVTVHKNTLRLAGEKRPVPEVPPQAYHRNERAAGRFVRTLQLGAAVDEERVAADYEGGILKVTLPKAEEEKPRKIEVQVG